MLRSGTVISLHELKVMGKSIGKIVRETGITPNKVRKFLRLDGISRTRTHAPNCNRCH